MSRQDANAAFALTSFLYGGNAPYIDDLYARYEADPKAVDAEWQSFFQSLKDNAADVDKNAHGPSWAPARLAAAAGRRSHRGARRQLGRGRQRRRHQGQGAGAKPRRRAFLGRRRTRDPRLDPGADADPRLSGARPFPRQSRSARPRAGRRTRRSSIRAPTASATPISTVRSFSTRCSGSNSAPSARSSPSCGAPIARRSASNFCTSRTAPRRAGFRSASKGRTRRSRSPAKASAPSSTSWSKPKASRNSAT